jgi:hypothetical protein
VADLSGRAWFFIGEGLNNKKKSIAVDISKQEGRELVLKSGDQGNQHVPLPLSNAGFWSRDLIRGGGQLNNSSSPPTLNNQAL